MSHQVALLGEKMKRQPLWTAVVKPGPVLGSCPAAAAAAVLLSAAVAAVLRSKRRLESRDSVFFFFCWCKNLHWIYGR